MPHPLRCFQGKEMFLFWDNNTNDKKKNTATKNVTKLSKYIYIHIYFILYNRVDVEMCDVAL